MLLVFIWYKDCSMFPASIFRIRFIIRFLCWLCIHSEENLPRIILVRKASRCAFVEDELEYKRDNDGVNCVVNVLHYEFA